MEKGEWAAEQEILPQVCMQGISLEKEGRASSHA
jgi:hypothetical protein